MKLIEKFNKYESLHSEILDAFDTEGFEAIDNHLSSRWIYYDRDSAISYLDEEGIEYGFDYASKVGEEVDGCVLFYVQDNGEKFYAIFSSQNRYKDYDEFCGQVNVKV